MDTHTLPNRPVLRQKAEEKLRVKKFKLSLDSSKTDFLAINHELLLHQIELEMQNDELLKTLQQAEQISEKYLDLYNLAPTGYFTLSKNGEIVETNLHASKLLGKKQANLIGSRFAFFVTEVSKPVFNQFIENVIVAKATETCVISLNIHNNQNTHALLTGHNSKNGEHCFIAVTDITELISNENKIKQLEYFNGIFVDRELKMVELKKEINQLLENAGLKKKY